MTNQSSAELMSLPNGGGALRALGDTFQPNLHTGTGTYEVPLELPAGRAGLTPRLGLSYSSGAGNGPFGMGWSLSVPGVRRKTEQRLPRYDATDVFVLSGAEDLVAVPGATEAGVQRYRPRTETLFARIEHHTTGTNHWTVWTGDGLRTTYGTPRPTGADATWRDPAAIAALDHPERVSGWLISSTVDTLGNSVAYSYAADPDDPAGAQRYLSQIGYADYGDRAAPSFLVQVRFVYERRPDRHVDRRAGFPVATGQRCTAIETWMNPGNAELARRVTLTYTDAAVRPLDNGVSLLARITVTGHDGDATQALPPLELGYTTWDPAARRYQPIGQGAAPDRSLSSRVLDLVDLFGDGLPDVLELNGPVARYWRNRGQGRFDPPRSFSPTPGGASLGAPGVQLLDADGDGRPDLLVTDGPRAGYFPIRVDAGAAGDGYHAYQAAPSFGLSDPLTRLIDLDGDGVVDALRIGTSLQVYLNDRARGWLAQPSSLGSSLDGISFADPRIKLADMTGDGLTDIVLVASGRLQYWPNLGYGRFGSPVVMDNSPRFEDANVYGPAGFDPARLLLGDVDGDGAADVVYVGAGATTVWVNRTGQAFAPPLMIQGTPRPDNAADLRLADVMGTGTAGVLWSYNAGAVRGDNYTFLDLTGGVKPYLLTRVDNHAGAVTTISYAPSTRYAQADAAAGTPWQTTLPFPVQVVASIQRTDSFSDTTLTTEYHYHHGHWDGADREFRGFGRVNQRDTLTPIRAGAQDPALSPPTETRSWFHLGPVGPESGAWIELDLRTEYWAGDPPLQPHTDLSALPAGLARRTLRDAVRGARGTLLRQEVYGLDGTDLAPRPYEISDSSVAVATVLDGRAGEDPGWQAGPVFTVRPTLTRASIWERGTDPMYRLHVRGNYDAYGRSASSLEMGVPRGHDPRGSAADNPQPYLAWLTSTVYATRDDSTGFVSDRVASVRRAELAATTATAALDVVAGALAGSVPTTLRSLSLTFYDGPPAAGAGVSATDAGGLPFGQLGDHSLAVRTEQLAITPERLAAASHTSADASAAPPAYVPLDGTPAAALPADRYPPAFAQALAPLAGYTWHPDGLDPATGASYVGGYYVQSSRHAYDVQVNAAGRGLVVADRDQLGHDTSIAYDQYELLPLAVTDPLGLTHSARYDYRTLRVSLTTDPNGNRTQAGYTPLGLLSWTASTGKDAQHLGDTVEQPAVSYAYHLTAYDDSGSASTRQPVSVVTTRRARHRWDVVDDANAARAAAGQPPLSDAEIRGLFPADEADQHPERFVRTQEYTDGFGRLLQARAQSDTLVLDDLGLSDDRTAPIGPARAHVVDSAAPAPVIVSSWKRYDDKGRVIEAYEPFFSTGYAYQAPDTLLLASLAKLTTRYDPRGLAVLVTAPDGSQTLTVPGTPPRLADPSTFTPSPWVTYVYDGDDNAGRTHPDASAGFAAQFDTPTSTSLDPLGRPVSVVQRFAPDDADAAVTTTTYDIDGNVVGVADPLGRTVSTSVYDLLNRPWLHASPDGGLTRRILDPAGGAIETGDDRGAVTLVAYDAAHRRARVWAAETASSVPTLREVLVYGDQAASGLGADDAAAANLLGRVYRAYDEAGRLTTSAYDLDGSLLVKTRQTLRADLLLAGLPTGPGTGDATAYRVDWQPAAGQALDQHAATLLDPTLYQTDAAYDALHRVTARTAPVDVEGTRVQFTYSHTPGGQLSSVTANGIAYLSHVIYNPRGQRRLAVLNDATLIRYAHDARTFRLTRLHAEPTTASASRGLTWSPTDDSTRVLQDDAYHYDLVGNLLALYDRTPGSGVPGGADPAHPTSPDALDRRFSYDQLYRLQGATGRETALASDPPWTDTPASTDLTRAQPYSESYQFDLAGNLLALRHASAAPYTRAYTCVTGRNQLQALTIGSSSFGYVYDPAGNMLNEAGVRQFEWDHANRLVSFRTQTDGAVPSVYAQYRYDATGNRTMKVVQRGGAAPEVTVYIDGLFERLWVSSGTSATSTHDTLHVLDEASRIAVLHRGGSGPGDPYPAATFHLGDHLGSSVAVLSVSGQLLNREDYAPFGETSFGSYARKRYRFTGQERDEETGLSYHGARYYAPWLGRWLSVDPHGLGDGPNLYAYARGNPLRWLDPTGKQAASADSSHLSPEDTEALRRFVNAPSGSDAVHPVHPDATIRPAQVNHCRGSSGPRPMSGPIDIPWANLAVGMGLSLFGPVGMALGFVVSVEGFVNAPEKPGSRLHSAPSSLELGVSGARTVALSVIGRALFGGGASRQPGDPFANLSEHEIDESLSRMSAPHFFRTPASASEAGTPLDKLVPVSRWGRPGLLPGDWVMKGPPSVSNWLRTGKWGPEWPPAKFPKPTPGSGQGFLVPPESVRWPGWRGIFGQRRYLPE